MNRDRRTVGPAAATWLAAWLATGMPWRGALAATLLLSAVLIVVLVIARRAPRPGSESVRWLVVGAIVCAAAAASVTAMRTHATQTGVLAELAADSAFVRVEAVVVTDPTALRPVVRGADRMADRVRLEIRVEQVTARGRTWSLRSPALVMADGVTWSSRAVGERLSLAGTVSADRAAGRFAAVLRPSADPVQIDEPSWAFAAADSLRAGLRDSVDGMPQGPASLVPALVVGDTSTLSSELVDDMRTTGLTHLTAVSGANVAIVVGAVIVLARWLRVPSVVTALLGAAACIAFVVLARPEPSVLRAAVMGVLALLALARGTGRSPSARRSTVAALATTVLMLLFVDPFLSRAYGFALSVLATGALVLLAPRWTAAWSRRIPTPLAAALAVPLAAQVVTAPVVLLLDPRLSLVAVPANLLVAPMVAPVTVLGVLATLAAPVSAPLAVWLGTAATACAWWIVTVARHAADVSWASLPVPGGIRGAVLLAAGLALAVVTAPLLGPFVRRHPRASCALGAAVATTWLVALPFVREPDGWPPPGWLAVFCDVGQGDATVLPIEPGRAVVVDAGPDPVSVDRCLDDLGITVVERVVLTHFHADHAEGLPGVLGGRSVSSIDVSPLDEPVDQADRVRDWARSAGVAVTETTPPDQEQLGALSWRVLWPARLIRDGSAPNNASIVMLVQSGGVRLLLTGDIESSAQRALVGRGGIEAEVAKVPHHGSGDFIDGLPAAVRPRVAVVSSGAGNPYGHPTRAAVDAWARVGATLVRTDRSGDIAIVAQEGGVLAVPRGG